MGKIAPERKASREFVFSGEVALDGSNPTVVVTPFKTILKAVVSLKSSSAPGVSTSVVSSTWSGGTLSIYGWKPTSSADTTLVASDGTQTVAFVVTGY